MHYFILTLLFFSSMEVVSKPLMGLVDPFTLTLYRFIMGFAVLLIFLLYKRRFREITALSKHELFYLALLGFINAFFSMSMLQLAVKYSSAATAATIFCSNSLFVFGFSVITGHEQFSLRRLSGLIVGIIGIIVIMYKKGFSFDLGIIFAVAASLAFAIYTMISKKSVKTVKPLTVNTVSFFFGILANLIFILITDRALIAESALFQSWSNVLALIYLGVGISAAGYITFIKTIKQFGAFIASLIFLFKPVVATFFAIVFLGETLHTGFYFGLVMIVAGSAMIKKKEQKV